MSETVLTQTPTRVAPSPELPPGTVVGDYRIARKLGEGGMGSVYEAVHPIIDKQVAIKVLRRELCTNDEAIARFVQEARAVNRIHHPNIVDVFGFGQTEDGRAFLAMELLEGRSLSSWLTRNVDPPEPLSLAEICDVLVEVAHALEAAHEAGIVHRDLKPDNIFLTKSRKGAFEVKLLDFGIAKLSAGGMHAPVDVTQPGTMVGTPQYVSPEQARSQALDGRADIYSLGVVAFELFTGRPPFISDNPVEMVAKHITLAPPTPSDFDPSLPELLDKLVLAMLEKDPERRPTLARVREVLAEVRTAPPSEHAAERAARRDQSTKLMAADDLPAPATTPASTVRFRWWLVPIAIGLVALGARIALALVGSDDDAAPPSEPIVAVPAPAPLPPPPPTQHASSPPAIDPIDKAMIEVDPVPAPKKPERVEKRADHADSVSPHAHRAAQKSDATTKAVEAKPADAKPTEPKIDPKPIEPAKPTAPEDDDALRSPFDRKHP